MKQLKKLGEKYVGETIYFSVFLSDNLGKKYYEIYFKDANDNKNLFYIGIDGENSISALTIMKLLERNGYFIRFFYFLREKTTREEFLCLALNDLSAGKAFFKLNDEFNLEFLDKQNIIHAYDSVFEDYPELDDKQFYSSIVLRTNDLRSILSFIENGGTNDTSNTDETGMFGISFHDVVVRSYNFRCLHNHKIRDFNGFVAIIDKHGKLIREKIKGGYCEECNTYFINENTYQQLRLKGIILCEIITEKKYFNPNSSSYGDGKLSQLADESTLMKYGYNVSESCGLSAKQRQAILGYLIKEKIMTSAEIIGYLSYFIKSRSTWNTDKYTKAISKREADLEFAENFNIDGLEQIGIKSFRVR